MKHTITILLLLVTIKVTAASYSNELTGTFSDSSWCGESAGLTARLCVDKTRVSLGQATPVFVVEVRNVSTNAISINDIFYSNMLLKIAPQKVGYTSDDLEWIFDLDRLRKPLEPGECVRAICKPPHRLVPSVGEYRFSLEIARGDKGGQGAPLRGSGWWAGVLRPEQLVVDYR